MATQFPLNPEVNDLYQGYYWDGNFWKRSGEDVGFGYLEEAVLQTTYLSQLSASTNYLTQASASTTYLTRSSASTTYLTQTSASTQYERLIPYSSSSVVNAEVGDLWIDSTASASPLLKTYSGSEWVQLGGSDNVFVRLNLQTVDENYTMPVGYNGVTAGPITIADGVTVTIPDGSAWSIV
jgi:hypothetical protein